MESLLLTIFKKIEESYGRFGEMGIDIGIDQGGNLWIIECNAKPGKKFDVGTK
ncbi:YheC/YheD family protein [Thalassobacillus sp. C254]|uniref:YheC/YheD family protein n=1 Tax=Thalassobacillus sp. C254 TaxID=1225341 RepID=UPI0035B5217F